MNGWFGEPRYLRIYLLKMAGIRSAKAMLVVGPVNFRATLGVVLIVKMFPSSPCRTPRGRGRRRFPNLLRRMLAKILRHRRQKRVRRESVAEIVLPAGCQLPDRLRRRFDAIKDDDRTLCVLQDSLVFLVELFASLKVEIFARLAAPIDLALAAVVGSLSTVSAW